MTTEDTIKKNHSLAAMQLGWLVVEAFGRLARYERASHKSVLRPGDKYRPLAFSINESLSLDELIWCVNQLHALSPSLALDEIPLLPIPRGKELVKKLEGDEFNLDALQGELDLWSKNVWGSLNAKFGLAAQAFVLGGGLANTFWYTIIVWADEKALAEFLNYHRLDYLATQFDLVSDELPDYLAESIAHSLRKWSTVNLDSMDRSRLKERLEAQQKVWRDLLLDKRSPESYLREKHRRYIRASSMGAQILFAAALLLAIVLAGREVGGLFPSNASKDLASFFAALSGFIVVVGGLTTQFSNWIKSVGKAVAGWMKRRLILKNTFRGC